MPVILVYHEFWGRKDAWRLIHFLLPDHVSHEMGREMLSRIISSMERS